jgi:hypothetical protein
VDGEAKKEKKLKKRKIRHLLALFTLLGLLVDPARPYASVTTSRLVRSAHITAHVPEEPLASAALRDADADTPTSPSSPSSSPSSSPPAERLYNGMTKEEIYDKTHEELQWLYGRLAVEMQKSEVKRILEADPRLLGKEFLLLRALGGGEQEREKESIAALNKQVDLAQSVLGHILAAQKKASPSNEPTLIPGTRILSEDDEN